MNVPYPSINLLLVVRSVGNTSGKRIKMKIKVKGISCPVDINDVEDVNLLGESLRDLFFGTEKGKGCYHNFEVQPNVKSLGYARVMPESDELYKIYHYENIKMMYHWDGDGTLIFVLENGKTLVNTDCKKEHIWNEYNSFDEVVCY
jgi:hypothetical protein